MRLKTLIAILVLCALTTCESERAGSSGGRKNTKVAGTTEVTVRITGLTSYADNPVDVAEGELQPMTMYMLNARKAHHPHVPIMMYHSDYKPTAPTDKRRTFTEGKFEYVELVGEELSFDGAEKNELDYEHGPIGCENIGKSSIHWIPRISQIATDFDGGPPDQSDLDDRYFYRAPNVKRVSALVDLSYGSLDVKPTIPLVWEFRTGNAGATLRQASVQVVNWSFTIPGEFLIVRSRRFEPAGSLPGPLVRLQANAGKIELTLANVVPADIKRMADGVMIDAEETDPHFGNYYQVVKDPNGTLHKRIPHIYGICIAGDELKGDTDEIRCEMKDFVKFANEPTCVDEDPVQPDVFAPRPPGSLGGVNCIPNRLP